LRNAGEKTAKVTKATKKAIQESNGLLGSFGLSVPGLFFLALGIGLLSSVAHQTAPSNSASLKSSALTWWTKLPKMPS